MIVSFRSRETEELFHDRKPKKLPADILQTARRKLMILHAAQKLDDLKIPPGNHLEALKEDRKGQHSIRINKKWRICFRFDKGQVFDVEITDYH